MESPISLIMKSESTDFATVIICATTKLKPLTHFYLISCLHLILFLHFMPHLCRPSSLHMTLFLVSPRATLKTVSLTHKHTFLSLLCPSVAVFLWFDDSKLQTAGRSCILSLQSVVSTSWETLLNHSSSVLPFIMTRHNTTAKTPIKTKAEYTLCINNH